MGYKLGDGKCDYNLYKNATYNMLVTNLSWDMYASINTPTCSYECGDCIEYDKNMTGDELFDSFKVREDKLTLHATCLHTLLIIMCGLMFAYTP